MVNDHIPVSVLIVDDNPAKLTALAAALDGMNLDIVTATSGTEALRKLLAQDFAAVLLDVNMPVMDGFETAATIRRRPKSEHLPILFITAERLSDDARLQGYALGAVDYILSPMLPQILRSKVAVFADLYRLREQVAARTTELLANEKRLQNILSSTPAVHYACRVDGERFVPTFVSDNLKEFFGYDCAENLGNAEWWWSGLHPEERDNLADALHAGLASGLGHYVHEYRFLHKNGNYCWIRDELRIIRDKSGQPQEIIGIWTQ